MPKPISNIGLSPRASRTADAFAKAFSAFAGVPAIPAQDLVEKASAPVLRETSALKVDSDRVCPYCKSDMVLKKAMGVPVYWCASDRHAAPARNEAPASPPEGT